jgi:hypothetical protein
VGDALAVPTVGAAVDSWLWDRPVSLVDFLDDRKVKVTLSARPDDLFDVFQGAVERQTSVPFPDGDAGWTSVKRGIAAGMAIPVGVGGVHVKPATNPARIDLPRQPPAWIDRQLEAVAEAGPAATLLKAVHLAQTEAIGRLRDQLRALPLTPDLTLGQAADRDGRIADSLDRALTAAHVFNADYHADGSVRVSVSLDLRAVWELLVPQP